MCIEFMDSSHRMRAIVATQGYANLKRTCPLVIVDVMMKTSKWQSIDHHFIGSLLILIIIFFVLLEYYMVTRTCGW
jgi:hypothetical protein